MVWSKIKNWWSSRGSTEIDERDTADFLHSELDKISEEIEGNTVNEIAEGAYSFIDTEKLVRFFYKRLGYYYSNEFFTVDSRRIMEYYGMSDYMHEHHNSRKRDWTDTEHEQRIAYLIAQQSYREPFIEIDLNEIESGIYDLLLVDGYHRLLAASLMMKPQIRVVAKDNYTLSLAIEILSEVQ